MDKDTRELFSNITMRIRLSVLDADAVLSLIKQLHTGAMCPECEYGKQRPDCPLAKVAAAIRLAGTPQSQLPPDEIALRHRIYREASEAEARAAEVLAEAKLAVGQAVRAYNDVCEADRDEAAYAELKRQAGDPFAGE